MMCSGARAMKMMMMMRRRRRMTMTKMMMMIKIDLYRFSWRHQLKHFQHQFRVVAFDNR